MIMIKEITAPMLASLTTFAMMTSRWRASLGGDGLLYMFPTNEKKVVWN